MRCHQRNCKTGILAFPRLEEDDNNEEDATAFNEQSSALEGAAKLFRLDYATGIRNLFPRLQTGIEIASDQLQRVQREGKSTKYFISLHCNFYKVTDPDVVTTPPVVFNSGSCTMLPASTVQIQLEIMYRNLLNKVIVISNET